MLEALFWLFVGLIIGWNVFPQPKWVETLYTKAFAAVKSWLGNSNNTQS